MIFFTVWKGHINIKGKNGEKKVKETSPSIDIQAFRFTHKTTKVISENTLVSIDYTAWLISNRPGMRFTSPILFAIEFHTLGYPNLKTTEE